MHNGVMQSDIDVTNNLVLCGYTICKYIIDQCTSINDTIMIVE